MRAALREPWSPLSTDCPVWNSDFGRGCYTWLLDTQEACDMPAQAITRLVCFYRPWRAGLPRSPVLQGRPARLGPWRAGLRGKHDSYIYLRFGCSLKPRKSLYKRLCSDHLEWLRGPPGPSRPHISTSSGLPNNIVYQSVAYCEPVYVFSCMCLFAIYTHGVTHSHMCAVTFTSTAKREAPSKKCNGTLHEHADPEG